LQSNHYSVDAVYLQEEVTYEETLVESRLKRNIKPLKVSLKTVFGLTMIHPDVLPWKNIQKLPDVFTEFRKGVEGMEDEEIVRPLATLPKQLKNAPKLEETNIHQKGKVFGSSSTGDVWEKPSLDYFEKVEAWMKGLLGDEVYQQTEKKDHRSAFPFNGSEGEALKRVKDYFFTTSHIDTYKQTRNGLVGTEYSSKFSPWLATGALSPMHVLHELRKVEVKRGGNDGTYWLWFELLWRDYFKYVAIKYENHVSCRVYW
jgi:deoxyribodipyrimidine photo-lyase